MVDEDVLFSVTLRNKETGLERLCGFFGQGSNEVSPYLLHETYCCDTLVILVTVQYPWRHALPRYVRILETYAFRASDFAFIDMTPGPLTDIALADDTACDPSEIDMLPPIKVRCRVDHDEKPFEFF
jgi:hypothetical protein